MNTTYLLITLGVICFTAFAISKANDCNGSYWIVSETLSLIASFFLVILSFAGDTGFTTISFAPPARIEHTPYCVITIAFGGEQVWTDAYTVANVANITQVRQTLKHNAWGIELSKPFGPIHELVFKNP